MRSLVALGGNAIEQGGESGSTAEQVAHPCRAAERLAPIVGASRHDDWRSITLGYGSRSGNPSVQRYACAQGDGDRGEAARRRRPRLLRWHGNKMAAAVRFAEEGGTQTIFNVLDRLVEARAGNMGTIIVPTSETERTPPLRRRTASVCVAS